MKICIARMDKMGDMILSLPPIKSIKTCNPEIDITVLSSNKNSFILKNLKYINSNIEINLKNNFFSILKKLINFRKKKYDLYINLSPTLLSYIFCFFSNSKKKASLIFLSRYRKRIFSKIHIRFFCKIFCDYTYTIDRFSKLKNKETIHQTIMIYDLFKICKIRTSKNELIDIKLPKRKLNFSNRKKLITIHMSKKWINKYYTEENFLNLLSNLPVKNYKYFLTTDSSTKDKFVEIYKKFNIINNFHFNKIKYIKSSITILDELKFDNWLKVIYSSAQVITPECGCTHISAACNTIVNIIYDSQNKPKEINLEYAPWKSKYYKFFSNDIQLNQKIISRLN